MIEFEQKSRHRSAVESEYCPQCGMRFMPEMDTIHRYGTLYACPNAHGWVYLETGAAKGKVIWWERVAVAARNGA